MLMHRNLLKICVILFFVVVLFGLYVAIGQKTGIGIGALRGLFQP